MQAGTAKADHPLLRNQMDVVAMRYGFGMVHFVWVFMVCLGWRNAPSTKFVRREPVPGTA